MGDRVNRRTVLKSGSLLAAVGLSRSVQGSSADDKANQAEADRKARTQIQGRTISLFGKSVDADASLTGLLVKARREVQKKLSRNDRMFTIRANFGLPGFENLPRFAHETAGTLLDGPVIGIPSIEFEDTLLSVRGLAHIYPIRLPVLSGGIFKAINLFKRHRSLLAGGLIFPGDRNLLTSLEALAQGDMRFPSSTDDNDQLWSYIADLINGDFVDRNGDEIATSFEFDSQRPLDVKLSPQVVVEIMRVLLEYVGDKEFDVPFYSPELLQVFRDARNTTIAADAEDAIKSFIANNAGGLSWATIPNSNVYSQQSTRSFVGALAALDAEAGTKRLQHIRAKAIIEALARNESTSLQERFTCFKAKVISDHLHCIFYHKIHKCDQDTVGNDDDYADVVGAVVAYASKLAERNTRSLVGGMVRGLSVGSLDNEVLAELLTTAVSTTVKKVVEYFAYYVMKEIITDPNILPNINKRDLLEELRKLHRAGELG